MFHNILSSRENQQIRVSHNLTMEQIHNFGVTNDSSVVTSRVLNFSVSNAIMKIKSLYEFAFTMFGGLIYLS